MECRGCFACCLPRPAASLLNIPARQRFPGGGSLAGGPGAVLGSRPPDRAGTDAFSPAGRNLLAAASLADIRTGRSRRAGAVRPRAAGGSYACAVLARQGRTSAAIRCPIPTIEEPRDAIIRVTSCAICGSDLHLYDGFMPGMESGDIIGHEFMGEVVEVGAANTKLKVGDRVVVPFTITCGECDQCRRGYFSVCERTNRNKADGRQDVRPHHRGPVRLHPPDRRLSRRPGGIRARAVCRRRPGQDPRRADRRAGAVPRRHLPDRLAGSGRSATSSRPTRWRSGAAGRSASSASAARSCSAPGRWSRSTACPSGSRWRRPAARSRSTSTRRAWSSA